MNSRARKLIILFAVAAGIAIPVAGCGSSDSSGSDSSSSGSSTATTTTGTGNGGGSGASTGSAASNGSGAATSSGGGSTLALAADPSGAISFDKTALTTKAGKTTIDFTNMSPTMHAVEVEGNGVEQSSSVITDGKTTLALNLKPGKYTFYCPVSDHREEGMEGTLTVK